MTSLIVRNRVAGRLVAVVLVVLMASPLTATFSTPGGSLETAMALVENARNEDATLTALVEPLAAPVFEARIPVVFLDAPPVFTIARALAQTQVLRV
jgi:hypothetical protein